MQTRTNRHGQKEISSNVYLAEDDHHKKVTDLMFKLKKSKSEIIRMAIDLLYNREN